MTMSAAFLLEFVPHDSEPLNTLKIPKWGVSIAILDFYLSDIPAMFMGLLRSMKVPAFSLYFPSAPICSPSTILGSLAFFHLLSPSLTFAR